MTNFYADTRRPPPYRYGVYKIDTTILLARNETELGAKMTALAMGEGHIVRPLGKGEQWKPGTMDKFNYRQC